VVIALSVAPAVNLPLLGGCDCWYLVESQQVLQRAAPGGSFCDDASGAQPYPGAGSGLIGELAFALEWICGGACSQSR
jgi:hypothetical protein